MNVFVVTCRVGTNMMAPEAFGDFDAAQASMEARYHQALGNLKEYTKTVDGACEQGSAMLETMSDTIEWEITECEVKSI